MKPFNKELDEFLDVPEEYEIRSKHTELICFALLVVVIIAFTALCYVYSGPVLV